MQININLNRAVAAVVSVMKGEIDHEIDRGRVPSTVRSFSELHDHIDANELGGALLLNALLGNDVGTDVWNAASDDVSEWLANGRDHVEVAR